jgi:hypothetical protein
MQATPGRLHSTHAQQSAPALHLNVDTKQVPRTCCAKISRHVILEMFLLSAEGSSTLLVSCAGCKCHAPTNVSQSHRGSATRAMLTREPVSKSRGQDCPGRLPGGSICQVLHSWHGAGQGQ